MSLTSAFFGLVMPSQVGGGSPFEHPNPSPRCRSKQTGKPPPRVGRWSFPGSPTIRVDGIDIDPEAPTGVGLG